MDKNIIDDFEKMINDADFRDTFGSKSVKMMENKLEQLKKDYDKGEADLFLIELEQLKRRLNPVIDNLKDI